jgi:flagellar biosynthesis/type III secretory pathway protein FliH
MSSFRVSKDRVTMFGQGVMIYPETAAEKLPPDDDMPEETAASAKSDAEAPSPAPAARSAAQPSPDLLSAEKERIKKREQELEARAQELEHKYEELMNSAQQEIESAKQEADKIRADAREHGKLLEAETETKLEKIREEGRAEGYELGMKQAADDAEKRKADEAQELLKLANELRGERDNMIDSLKPDVISLVMEITRRVIRTELDENNSAFVDLVSYEVSKLKQNEFVTVSVSVDDFEKYFSGGQAELGVEGDSISVQENKRLAPGDCIIETDSEIIDCGISGQLERVEQILMREAGLNSGDT